MDGIKEMKEAMLKLQKACINTNYTRCGECPFGDYCTILHELGKGIPEDWIFEEDK